MKLIGDRDHMQKWKGGARGMVTRSIDITTLRNGTDHRTLSKPETHNG